MVDVLERWEYDQANVVERLTTSKVKETHPKITR